MNRRTLLKMLATLPLLTRAPFLLADKERGEMGERVIYGPPVMPTILLGIASRQGELRKTHPFKVKVWKNPDQLRAGLANRDINTTIVPSYVSANLEAQGQRVKLVNVMTFGMLYVMGRGPKLTSFKDMVGKRLTTPFKNDLPDLLLQIMCKAEGVDPASLNVTYVSAPPEAVMLLMQGKVDYAMVPEPLATMSTLRGKMMGQDIQRLLDVQEVWGRVFNRPPRISQAGLLVTTEVLEENRKLVGVLQKDLENAAIWANENPRAAAEIGANYLPIPANALELALPYSKLCADPAIDVADEVLFFFKKLYELNPKIVGGKMPDRSLFANLHEKVAETV